MIKSRITIAYYVVIICFFVLICRYSYLQLIGHSSFLQKSINNSSASVFNLPTRGTIVDRNHVILANNIVSYAIGILPKNIQDQDELFIQLSKYITINKIDKLKFTNQLKNAKNFDWVIIKDELTDQEIAQLTAHNFEFPQIFVFARIRRYYPFHKIYAHSIGYVARVSPNDLQKITQDKNDKEYLVNDYMGKNGLEYYYESALRGKLGKKIIQTDAFGNEMGLIANVPAKDGDTMQLTIDNDLQNLAYKLIDQHKGAIVALDPNTGGILAFVSNPSYDPNWFIDGISIDDWGDLRDNPEKPLLNRGIQSSFPPGSTFKPFLGLGALELGFRKWDTKIFDPGYFIVPKSKHKFRDNDWPLGLGYVDLTTAITFSSDVYFYKLAYDMGIDNIDLGVMRFGFGSKTGVDLPMEASGLLPTREWKKKRFAYDNYQKNWLGADSVNVGIGQGFNHYTPMQMAYATSIIANEGIAVKPHFLDKLIDNQGRDIFKFTPKFNKIAINVENVKRMKLAMQKVIQLGTAKGINFGLKYTVAGKTGTAQVVATKKNGRQPKYFGKQFRDHSWFIAFAPVENPKIVLVILIENGGFGATTAVPIARKLLDLYLLDSYPKNLK